MTVTKGIEELLVSPGLTSLHLVDWSHLSEKTHIRNDVRGLAGTGQVTIGVHHAVRSRNRANQCSRLPMAHRLVKSFSGTFGFTHLVFIDARHGLFVED
jgi:hypothetical protein